MNIIEIQQAQTRWVAAVYADESVGQEYLNALLQDKRITVEHTNIEISFPVYAVKNTSENSALEYLDASVLYERMAGIVKQGDDQHEYFTYYIFEEEYFHQVSDGTVMNSIYSAVVNNNYLRDYVEPYGIRCITREMLENLAYYVDVEGMDRYYNRCTTQGTEEDKAELVEAYMQLFGQMCYDYACHKFTYEGLLEIMSIVANVELLQGEILWELRADAYLNLLEAAAEEDPEQVLSYGERCVEALKMYITEVGNEYRSCEKLSRVYHLLADHDEINRFQHWKNGLLHIQEAVQDNPAEVNWTYYLQLLHTPLAEEDSEIEANIPHEKQAFNTLISSLKVPGIEYRVAHDIQRLKDSGIFEVRDEESIFWLNASLKSEVPSESEFTELSDAGHFYQTQGVQMQRLDLLERSLEYYRLYQKIESDSGFQIYYIARVLEDIATVYITNNDSEKADEFMSQALVYYAEHEPIVTANFSSLCHYAEFLERCYRYNGKITKPALEKIRYLAMLAEQEGKGFYGLPFFIQARVALEEKNEVLAIFQLQRSLLLHELCIDGDIKGFSEAYKNNSFPALNKFMENTLQFMKDVDEGYYYNPELRWPAIEAMNIAQINVAWENRMEEIRSRKNA